MTIKKTAAESETFESENPKTETETASNTSQSFDNIAESLADSMPEVQEHAIEQEKIKADELKEAYSDLKDSDGNSFDPAIHKTNKEGEPTLSTKGKLIKKPTRKAATGAKSTSTIGGTGVNPQQNKDHQLKVQSRASGTMAANLLLTIGVAAGGEEWQPIKNDEHGLDEKAMLEGAFADYFEATGKTDIPPNMALTIAIGSYTLPRFTMPKTQSRLSKVKQWFTKKAANRKLKKYGLKAESADKKATLEA